MLLSNSQINGQEFVAVQCVELGGEMFKNTFQSGFLSILYSIGSKPLQIWEKQVQVSLNVMRSRWNTLPLQVRNGHIKRITDNDIQSLVIEIEGTNVRFVNPETC